MVGIAGAQRKKVRDYTKYRKNQITVKVPIHKEKFQRYCDLAVKAKMRRAGLQLYTQKTTGFNETSPNTDGLARFFKFCVNYWDKHEADILEEQARIVREEQELAERKRKAGMIPTIGKVD